MRSERSRLLFSGGGTFSVVLVAEEVARLDLHSPPSGDVQHVQADGRDRLVWQGIFVAPQLGSRLPCFGGGLDQVVPSQLHRAFSRWRQSATQINNTAVCILQL